MEQQTGCFSDLLERDTQVTVIVRPTSNLGNTLRHYPNYRQVSANITEMSDNELSTQLDDCDAVLSCLGPKLNFQGIFGEPGRLVTDTVEAYSDQFGVTSGLVPRLAITHSAEVVPN